MNVDNRIQEICSRLMNGFFRGNLVNALDYLMQEDFISDYEIGDRDENDLLVIKLFFPDDFFPPCVTPFYLLSKFKDSGEPVEVEQYEIFNNSEHGEK